MTQQNDSKIFFLSSRRGFRIEEQKFIRCISVSLFFGGVTNFRDLCQHSRKQIENVANSLNEALGAYLIINQGHVTIVAYCRCQIIVFPIRRPFSIEN